MKLFFSLCQVKYLRCISPLRHLCFSMLDTGLRWGVKRNTACVFCSEIGVCQHFNTHLQSWIFVIGFNMNKVNASSSRASAFGFENMVELKTISVLQLLHLWFICLFPWTEFSGNNNNNKRRIISSLSKMETLGRWLFFLSSQVQCHVNVS